MDTDGGEPMDQEHPPAFDETTRALIRQKLLHYMRRHRIGVPALAKRVTDVAPRKQEIPIKTLQRFLAGHIWTIDSYVSLFQRFAENLPDPDPIGSLGKAMAGFYRATDSQHLAGEYTLTIGYATDPQRVPFAGPMTVTPDDGFCRVVARLETTLNYFFNEGVLVSDGKSAVLSLRDKMTNAPKHFFLKGNTESHSGNGVIVKFDPHAEDVVTVPDFDFMMTRMERQ